VTPKRERGKPPSLPDEYLVDLINLPHYYGSRLRSLSAICRHIVASGGVEWIDAKTGETVHKITNARTLRSRLVEARNWYSDMKRRLLEIKHPIANKFELPVRFGITVERRERLLPPSIQQILGQRRRKLEMFTVGPLPKCTTRLRVGKKDVHRPK